VSAKRDRHSDEALARISPLVVNLRTGEHERDGFAQRFGRLQSQHGTSKQTVQNLSSDAVDPHRFSASLFNLRADREPTELRTLQDETFSMTSPVDRSKAFDDQMEMFRREKPIF
jgi:hypothetical protein